MRPSRRFSLALLFAACVVASGCVSIWLGQDTNWDLRDYHFYNAHSLIQDRLDFDLAPAQVQTYYNPLGDVPFYVMAMSGAPARLIAFVMGLSTAVALFFMLRTLWLLFRDRPDFERRLCVVVAAAIGFTGAAGVSVIGSTMNEWPPIALMSIAIFELVSIFANLEDEKRHAVPLAGAAAGLATALKLSFGAYAMALLLAIATIGPFRARLRRCLRFVGFAALGFIAAYGFWGVALQRRFGSPFFPIFNSLFRSPYWEQAWFPDTRWQSQGFVHAITLPFRFATNYRLVSNVEFRDFRFAAVLALALLCVVKLSWRRVRALVRPGSEPARAPAAPAWQLVATTAIASYLLLMKGFGIYLRYLILVELLSGALIVACLVYLLRGARWRQAAIGLTAMALLFTTRKMDWGRTEFSGAYFHVSPPQLPPNSLVILFGHEPMAYTIPFFRDDARFVASWNHFIQPGQNNLLAWRLIEVVSTHQGPIYSLEPKQLSEETAVSYGLTFTLNRDASSCASVKSNMDGDALRVCRLYREIPKIAEGIERHAP